MGISFKPQEFPKSLLDYQKDVNSQKGTYHVFHQNWQVYKTPLPIRNPLDLWREWVEKLPELPQELGQLDLLGSSHAQYCVHFNWVPWQAYHNVENST